MLTLMLSSLVNAANLRVEEGRPIVDGVYVNGDGPYRFLVDTGTNVNLVTPTPGSDGNEVVLNSVNVDGQKFL